MKFSCVLSILTALPFRVAVHTPLSVLFFMSEEIKCITDNTQIVDFGDYLNSLDDSSSFEIENQAGQMKTSSRSEVIKQFQDFFDRKTDKFKIHITGFRDGKLFVEKKNIIRLATISN